MRAFRSFISACIHSAPFGTLKLSYNKRKVGNHSTHLSITGLLLTFVLCGCGHKGPLIAPERADKNAPEVVEGTSTQPNTMQLPETHSH